MDMSGNVIIRIGVEAKVLGDTLIIPVLSTLNVGAGSHIEYEVAFYETKAGTKYTSGSAAPQWVTKNDTATILASNPARTGQSLDK